MTRADRIEHLVIRMRNVRPDDLHETWVRLTDALNDVADKPLPKFADMMTALEQSVQNMSGNAVCRWEGKVFLPGCEGGAVYGMDHCTCNPNPS